MILIPVFIGLYLIAALGYTRLVLVTWVKYDQVSEIVDQYPYLAVAILVGLGVIWPLAIYYMLFKQALGWAKS